MWLLDFVPFEQVLHGFHLFVKILFNSSLNYLLASFFVENILVLYVGCDISEESDRWNFSVKQYLLIDNLYHKVLRLMWILFMLSIVFYILILLVYSYLFWHYFRKGKWLLGFMKRAIDFEKDSVYQAILKVLYLVHEGLWILLT